MEGKRLNNPAQKSYMSLQGNLQKHMIKRRSIESLESKVQSSEIIVISANGKGQICKEFILGFKVRGT